MSILSSLPVLLLLPAGEGWDEGKKSLRLFKLTPHPNPLPRGEGNKARP